MAICNRQLNITILVPANQVCSDEGFFNFQKKLGKHNMKLKIWGLYQCNSKWFFVPTNKVWFWWCCKCSNYKCNPFKKLYLSTFISVKAICMLQQFSVKLQQKKLIDLNVEKISTWKNSKIISYCVAMLFRQTALCHYSPNTKNQLPNTKSRGTVP